MHLCLQVYKEGTEFDVELEMTALHGCFTVSYLSFVRWAVVLYCIDLETGVEPPVENPLRPDAELVNKLVACSWLLSGALESLEITITICFLSA